MNLIEVEKIREDEKFALKEGKRLLRSLEELGVGELLSSVKNNIWKTGIISKGIPFNTDLTLPDRLLSGRGGICLTARWPKYVPKNLNIPEHLEEVFEKIEVFALNISNKIVIEVGSTVYDHDFYKRPPFKFRLLNSFGPNTVKELIEVLRVETEERRRRSYSQNYHPRLPYDLTKEKDEKIIVANIRKGYFPNGEFRRYLLGKARKRS